MGVASERRLKKARYLRLLDRAAQGTPGDRFGRSAVLRQRSTAIYFPRRSLAIQQARSSAPHWGMNSNGPSDGNNYEGYRVNQSRVRFPPIADTDVRATTQR